MKKKMYFENLDGLRFFCFFAVFMFHSFYTEFSYIKNDGTYILVKEIFRNGNMGVNFFFVLSGYLITYLLIEEKRINNRIDTKSFWIRRILRIWPLYFFCVIFGFYVFPEMKIIFGKNPQETAHIFYYLTFLSNFDLINSGYPDAPILTILWSIAIEEQFYLVWPIILALVPLRRQWIVFVVIIITSILFRSLNDTAIVHEHHTLSCIGDMGVGAIGAWLCIFSNKFVEFFKNTNKCEIIVLYAAFVFVFIFRDEIFYANYEIRIFERLLLSVLILLIILEQNYSDNSLFKMKDWKNITYLGTITYGLYCLHYIGILTASTLTGLLGINIHLWQIIFIDTSVALGISIIISILSYNYYERPFMKMKERYAYITR